MILDFIIILLVISALFRGREIGFVQQLFSTVGFFGGLVLGAMLQPHTVGLVQSPMSRSLITLVTTVGMAFLFLAIGESLGVLLKQKVRMGRLNRLDNGLGGVLSIVSILAAVWLSAAVIRTLPFTSLQTQVRGSKIASALTQHLPYAPDVIASIGRLIDPNGFPQVFRGLEPNPPSHINLPSSSALLAAVNKDRASTVKIVGQGCGGIVDGSGFVVGDDMVVTNAHVVAGISRQYVTDSNGTHRATAIWFDRNLDLAILRVSNLAGAPLALSDTTVPRNTPAAVLGFPGGGGFTANPASVLEAFTATGTNIYGRGSATRRVYTVAANVQPGNSGGPVVAQDGAVIGVVFAKSTSYNNVGYALTMKQVISAINKANAQGTAVTTGSCAE